MIDVAGNGKIDTGNGTFPGNFSYPEHNYQQPHSERTMVGIPHDEKQKINIPKVKKCMTILEVAQIWEVLSCSRHLCSTFEKMTYTFAIKSIIPASTNLLF